MYHAHWLLITAGRIDAHTPFPPWLRLCISLVNGLTVTAGEIGIDNDTPRAAMN